MVDKRIFNFNIAYFRPLQEQENKSVKQNYIVGAQILTRNFVVPH